MATADILSPVWFDEMTKRAELTAWCEIKQDSEDEFCLTERDIEWLKGLKINPFR
jgi:hypothetical protein